VRGAHAKSVSFITLQWSRDRNSRQIAQKSSGTNDANQDLMCIQTHSCHRAGPG
jgi:hypothetical protein